MFNTSGGVDILSDVRESVESGDQSWRDTVDKRFSEYLLFRARGIIETADFQEGHISVAPKPDELRKHIDGLRARASAMIEASGLPAADPVGAESMMRASGW